MALTEEDLKTIPEDGIDPENPGKYQTLLKDLQGNILNGHGRDHIVHLFLQFKSGQVNAVKRWIQNFAQKYIKSAEQQSDEAREYRTKKISGGIFANLYLSCQGYEYLQIDPWKIPTDQPFRLGMQNSDIQSSLNDPPPTDWESGFQQKPDALLLIADDNLTDLLKAVKEICSELSGLSKILHREDGFILRNAQKQIIEHFGYVDGVSQPLFLKRNIASALTNNSDFSKWDPRAPLSLILVKDPNGKTEDSYGSYLVCRKLEQDVQKFRQEVQNLAKQLGIDEALAGALVVGRFEDGTPVTLSNLPSQGMTSTNYFNNFNYDLDTQATRCPFHTHIRKVNPRGDTGRVESSPGFDEALKVERKHRIARRSVSFGEQDCTKEPTTGSGLLFLCFQADIENQFNLIQTRWANPKNFVQVNVGPDPLIGQPQGTQKWPKKWGGSISEEYGFKLPVKMKGGEYFFAPSLSFFKNLAITKF
ncbi:Dyp-type peroxidase [Nostoc sp. PA-18-2419]|uniref:Dyp-type peroxidase n=1 Tax=Nostoc sp. PA-18-2419 TaxID=2575443 RepID=UPI0011099709|nr:Dyp-type peroxidase [Nostoc sp. PA-18-2419]